ncbi:MAG TPA: TonB-dependent receptor [Bryobacteraceae bacterium]|nr:TonB-dependent receptor [Bryobacteraceae bacterium]
MKFLRPIFFCAVIGVVLSVTALAQSLGALHGSVLDPSGAAIPKATVTVTGPNNTVKVAQTDNDGAYTINGLPPGLYTVRVIATGFTLFEKTGVNVSAGRPQQLDAKLTLEASKQEVTVADTQQVELDPSKNAGALVLKQEDLDMLSDDPDDLQADLLALAGPAAGPNGGQFFIDGFSSGELPPKDSIREIRINSNPFSAEYDVSGRGRIEIFTKPGTEKYHGSVNLVYSDHLWDARNPFAATPGFALPASDTKNLQANFGGPIIKKKMSFFIDFSRRQQRLDQLVTAQVLAPGCSSLTFGTPCNFLSQSYGALQPNTFNNVSPRIDYQLTQNITLSMRYRWDGRDLEDGGVGGFNLPGGVASPVPGTDPESTYHQHQTNQTVQFIETQVVNPSVINESHFQFFSSNMNQFGDNPTLNVNVAEAFTVGSSFAENYTHNKNYEFQNYTSITHGTHFIKFGARIRGAEEGSYNTSNFPDTAQFNFDSLAAFAKMEQGVAQGIPFSQILAAGGGPYQYIFTAGQPLINVSQVDAGLFVQDDWKILPNLTISPGLRYEVQNNIPDHGDWAPRIGLAWGIGPAQARGRAPKTVVRAGFGFFYDRFSLGNVLSTIRYNGVNDLSYTIPNPAFYPGAGVPVPPLSQLEAPQYAGSLQTDHIDGTYQSPRMQQLALGIDRQLPKNVTLSVNYINSRGTHVLRTVDINSPLPGTFIAGNPVYPLGENAGYYDLFESSGLYKQSQLIFNVNGRISPRISIFGFYAYGHVDTNVPNPGGQPSNPYNFNADWGPANYDIRHRVSVNGSIYLPFALRLSPNITYNSAPPLNIVEGIDPIGDSLLTTARPAFAPAGFSAPACTQELARDFQTCLVSGTRYGSFVINAPGNLPQIPSNYFRGYSQFNFNVRLSRSWGFGESTTPQNNPRRGGGPGGPGGFGRAIGGGGGGGRGGPGGGGFGGMFGESSGRRYTLTASIMVHNLFNTVNPGQIENDLLSPRLGDPLALANIGGYGGNAQAQAFNRRIDFSLRFAF